MITNFSKFNRFFISDEIQHTKFPYKVKNVHMLKCGGTIKEHPIYTVYTISFITYNDSNHQLITNFKLGFEITDDGKSEIINYYKEKCHELDKSFESTFMMMYDNVDIMNMMSDMIKKQIKII